MDNPSSFKHFINPWLSLVGIILLQSISSTSSNFPAYSSQLVQLLSISNVQLNNLFIASETGKLFVCFPNAAADRLPIWVLLVIGTVLGFIGYGVQFLFLVNKITSLSYWHLVLLQVLAGNSICWINTACNEAAKKNFPTNFQTIVALVSSYSSLSGKIYTSMVEGVHGHNGARIGSTYLLLNCLVPVGFGLAFMTLVRDSKVPPPPVHQIITQTVKNSTLSIVFITAFAAEVYAIIDSVVPAFQHVPPRLRLAILMLMIMLPLVVPVGIWVHNNVVPQASINQENKSNSNESSVISVGEDERIEESCEEKETVVKVRKVVGDEHEVMELVLSLDFWLYFWAYACGAALSIVYFNNLECISRSRSGHSDDETQFLLAITSSFSFFGRLFTVMLDWSTRGNQISRPLTMTFLMIPMTSSFFLLLKASNHYFYISTAILGICSGLINTISASITSELFGPKNCSMNHQIVLANVPVACMIFGYLAALTHHRESCGRSHEMCSVGVGCYCKIFIIWGSICSFGTILSFILYLRTRKFYMQRRSC